MEAVRDTKPAAAATETVVCLPAGSQRRILRLAVALGPGLALTIFFWSLLSTHHVAASLTNALCFSGLFLALSPVSALYLQRACIVADVEGLRWRYGGDWKRAAWSGVVSYSNDWPTTASPRKTPSAKIKTLGGTLMAEGGEWTSELALREIVQRHATAVSSPGWVVTGNAPDYLPMKCRYDTTVNRNILGWMEKVHQYGMVAVAIYFALQWFTTHTLPGWGWLLTPTGLFVIAKQTLPFLLRPTYRATQPRLADKVFADKDGLRFISGGTEAAIAWADITDLYSVGIRSVVVTRDSGEYDFLDTLTDSERLKLVIPRLATNAGYRGWRTGTMQRQQITLGDGSQSKQCVYRYRSQGNSSKLCGLTLAALFLAAVAGGPALIAWQSGSAPSLRELGLAAGGLLGVLAVIWLWGNYFCGAIRINEAGIMQQTLFGRRFMPWGQVRAFCWRGGADLTWGCVEGMNGTIKFWKGIGDAERLANEIKERTMC